MKKIPGEGGTVVVATTKREKDDNPRCSPKMTYFGLYWQPYKEWSPQLHLQTCYCLQSKSTHCPCPQWQDWISLGRDGQGIQWLGLE